LAARTLAVASIANIGSTIVGTIVVLGTSMLLSVGNIGELPGAEGDITVLIALVPCFYLSVWCETLIGFHYLQQFSRDQVRAAFFLANEFSYAMLAIVAIGRFAKNVIIQGRIVW
jgi:uncharacterized membrane protein